MATVATARQALEYCGAKVRTATRMGTYSRSKRNRVDEARDILAGVVLAHVPVPSYDFRAKRAYVCVMIRRILHAMADRTQVDDKDYYGNKRLELAGQLLALAITWVWPETAAGTPGSRLPVCAWRAPEGTTRAAPHFGPGPARTAGQALVFGEKES